eukprot:TRINITY_DN7948_c0_g1_i1.p1 TRINITY_DN7948_c0_g1~~TRINITY_DN7948_c0_g1_i1.p1  ORF type:complete len:130 (+),score=35.72 TRINITY_DN7948_c0_g1_i1:114-503(+)
MAAKGKFRVKNREGGMLVAVIGDEETITGFLLAGTGEMNSKRQSNFLLVTNKTRKQTLEEKFKEFTKREEIAVILINQYIADQIRHLLDAYDQLIPTILEIPSKESPYDITKDSVMARVQKLLPSNQNN